MQIFEPTFWPLSVTSGVNSHVEVAHSMKKVLFKFYLIFKVLIHLEKNFLKKQLSLESFPTNI